MSRKERSGSSLAGLSAVDRQAFLNQDQFAERISAKLDRRDTGDHNVASMPSRTSKPSSSKGAITGGKSTARSQFTNDARPRKTSSFKESSGQHTLRKKHSESSLKKRLEQLTTNMRSKQSVMFPSDAQTQEYRREFDKIMAELKSRLHDEGLRRKITVVNKLFEDRKLKSDRYTNAGGAFRAGWSGSSIPPESVRRVYHDGQIRDRQNRRKPNKSLYDKYGSSLRPLRGNDKKIAGEIK